MSYKQLELGFLRQIPVEEKPARDLLQEYPIDLSYSYNPELLNPTHELILRIKDGVSSADRLERGLKTFLAIRNQRPEILEQLAAGVPLAMHEREGLNYRELGIVGGSIGAMIEILEHCNYDFSAIAQWVTLTLQAVAAYAAELARMDAGIHAAEELQEGEEERAALEETEQDSRLEP